jgi:uncharacterized damage-inducible protein DinB
MDDLRFPTGKFSLVPQPTPSQRQSWIRAIADTPAKLRRAVAGLSDAQLDTPYRPEGWTIRQVVHHVPDSHMNAYVRLKLALTEDTPTIKPYDESEWARLPDARTSVEDSLALLEALHRRWVILLESMKPADFGRQLVHPERGLVNNDWLLQLYAWHGPHHTGHVTSLRQREGW